MKLDVKVDEADVGEVKVGDRATFTVDAYPGRSFAGQVTRIDLGANATPTVNSAGTTTNSSSTVVSYTASLTVANPDTVLRPGMTATASILTAVRRNVMLVPNAALRFTPEGWTSGTEPQPALGRSAQARHRRLRRRRAGQDRRRSAGAASRPSMCSTARTIPSPSTSSSARPMAR